MAGFADRGTRELFVTWRLLLLGLYRRGARLVPAGLALWVSIRGVALDTQALFDVVTRHTRGAFGHALNPHMLRDCAASRSRSRIRRTSGSPARYSGIGTRQRQSATSTWRTPSSEDQVRVCRVRAEREGWVVVDVYADYAINGASAARPRFQQMWQRRGAARLTSYLLRRWTA